MELFPQSDTSFFFVTGVGDLAKATFIQGETGHISHVMAEVNGATPSFRRINPYLEMQVDRNDRRRQLL
jgi:hypothetical protein